jgi:phage gpG-like protein
MEIVENNKDEILDGLDEATEKILTMIGIKIERYAKALCPVGTTESTGKKGYRGGTLRNSITYEVEGDTLMAGSNVEYAPYVELGTGGYFTPPPDWESFESTKGSGAGSGYVHPRPYLRPAVEDHLSEYSKIIEGELGGGS